MIFERILYNEFILFPISSKSKASLDFFRVSEMIPEVEKLQKGESRTMFKKRVEVADPADLDLGARSGMVKADNITTFKAVLSRKMAEEAWGWRFDPRLENAGQLVVRNVETNFAIPNVVTRWNRTQQEKRTPYLEIRVGDRFLSVNQKTSTYAMSEQLEKCREIRVEIMRTSDSSRQLPDQYYKSSPRKVDEDRLLAEAERNVNLFNAEVMKEPHRVVFADHAPLGRCYFGRVVLFKLILFKYFGN